MGGWVVGGWVDRWVGGWWVGRMLSSCLGRGAARYIRGLLLLPSCSLLTHSSTSTSPSSSFSFPHTILQSLSTLGRVISTLAEGGPKDHIPYRDSKLTYILKVTTAAVLTNK
jgi:hypothetical protein